MQRFRNSWHVRNDLVTVLRFNKSLKLAECMMGIHTRLLRSSTDFHPCVQCIHYCSCVVDNAREDPCPFPKCSCLQKLTSDSWWLKYIELQYPKNFQVEQHNNLTIRIAPQCLEPAQQGEFNTMRDSVEDLDGFPHLEHIEILADSEPQLPPQPLLRTAIYPAAVRL